MNPEMLLGTFYNEEMYLIAGVDTESGDVRLMVCGEATNLLLEVNPVDRVYRRKMLAYAPGRTELISEAVDADWINFAPDGVVESALQKWLAVRKNTVLGNVQ